MRQVVGSNHAYLIPGSMLAGATVLLDPAPAQPIRPEWLALCDYVTPNETELSLLTGMPVRGVDEAAAAARKLLDLGAKAVLNKRGAQGVLLVTREGAQLYAGFKVNAVDTTAAGDSFNGGFAVGLSEGMDVAEAIRLANAAASLSVTRKGAQTSIPSRAEVEALLADRK